MLTGPCRLKAEFLQPIQVPTLPQAALLQDPTNYQWMYCNLVMEASHLFLPLADPQQEASAGSQGLFLEWQQFRAGYFFGGDGQYITRLNAFDLGAWAARSDGTSQVGLAAVPSHLLQRLHLLNLCLLRQTCQNRLRRIRHKPQA